MKEVNFAYNLAEHWIQMLIGKTKLFDIFNLIFLSTVSNQNSFICVLLDLKDYSINF